MQTEQLWSAIETSAQNLIALPLNSRQERETAIELQALCKAYAIIQHGSQDFLPEFITLYRDQVLSWAELSTRKAA